MHCSASVTLDPFKTFAATRAKVSYADFQDFGSIFNVKVKFV
ncbi:MULTISPECIES: hypothetical protein [unclassified Sulfitobacter]|nr:MULTISPECIES: hypothetical protein [unclassified Sulfitobacter]